MDTDPCLPPLFLISHSSPRLTFRAPITIIPAVLPLTLDLAWDIGIGLVHSLHVQNANVQLHKA